jgi:hypothetical protein
VPNRPGVIFAGVDAITGPIANDASIAPAATVSLTGSITDRARVADGAEETVRTQASSTPIARPVADTPSIILTIEIVIAGVPANVPSIS